SWHLHVLATDVRRRAIEHGHRGVYPAEALQAVRRNLVEQYFARAGDGLLMVKPHLRKLVSFARQNLADLDYTGRFDCIVCIDVLPYLGADCARAVMRRFFEYLEPGGYLLLGSDTLEWSEQF